MTEFHPTPWRVHYGTQQGWHQKANPCVHDANGKLVVRPPQYVKHQGAYDAQADEVCNRIVRAVNNSELQPVGGPPALTKEEAGYDSLAANIKQEANGD